MLRLLVKKLMKGSKMRIGLISKWAAASVVVLTALAAGAPAGAQPIVQGGGGLPSQPGTIINRPVPQTTAPQSIYQLTTASRAVLVPIGQTQGHPFVAMRRALHPNFSSESVLHSFAGTDGAAPQGASEQFNVSPVKLLGTAAAGGSTANGTAWRLVVSPLSFSDMHNFTGPDGSGPVNLSGTGASIGVAQFGGAHSMGAVYKITPSGNVMVLHSFAGVDGAQPLGNPLSFVDGCIYGTTSTGGSFGFGTIWQICGAKFRTLHSFNENAGEGGEPTAGLSVAIKGLSLSPNLYGTTQHGGTPGGAGTIYGVSPSSGAVTTLFSFDGGPNGGNPMAELTPDFSGNLFGTANGGGLGIGTAFRFSLTLGTLSVLFTFGSDNPLGAANPVAPLAFDASGDLFGTAPFGGNPNQGGVVFELPAGGGYSQLWSFGAGTDGVNPLGPVVVGTDGSLYGTTQVGGVNFDGAIWRLQ
jgi:uncharacterized repeat protein (TIGR03803 family)